jgi:predicted TIM-barrel fold metal-dependent hydrolase
VPGTSGVTRPALVDAHHHLWDLDLPGYDWLRGGGVSATSAWIGDYTGIRRSFLLEDYLRDASGAGLAKSVHVEAARGPDHSLDETRWLQAIADERGFPHAIVAAVDLASPNAKAELDEHLRYPNVRGIRTIRMGGFADRDFRHGFARLAERGLSFDANLRLEQASELRDLATAFAETVIVIDNMANPLNLGQPYLDLWRAAMEPVAAAPNVAMKISGLGMAEHDWTIHSIRPWVLAALDLFSPARCMFGTNWPVDRLYGSLPTLVNSVRSIVAEVSETAPADVFEATAERCYRL